MKTALTNQNDLMQRTIVRIREVLNDPEGHGSMAVKADMVTQVTRILDEYEKEKARIIDGHKSGPWG